MTGEEMHERCRFGLLGPVTEVSGGLGQTEVVEKVLPMCWWEASEPQPPPLRRAWNGGPVDPERDCANCPAYRPLT